MPSPPMTASASCSPFGPTNMDTGAGADCNNSLILESPARVDRWHRRRKHRTSPVEYFPFKGMRGRAYADRFGQIVVVGVSTKAVKGPCGWLSCNMYQCTPEREARQ